MTGAQQVAAMFADVGDDEIGHAVWGRVEERIGGTSISEFLRDRGHGWTLRLRPKPFAEVRPLPRATRLHHGETISIRIGFDGSRRGGFLALYRCFDAAVTGLVDVLVVDPTLERAKRLPAMAVGS